MNLDRRQFLLVMGAAAAASRTTTLRAQAPAAAAGSARELPWHQRIRRVGQVNFNERDPLELDVEAWADYWTELQVDAVMVSVTGILAFYPTDVPFHRRSRFLGDRDLFGECCTAAKQRGLRVIARLSPDLQWQDAMAAHPEWFRRDAAGQPMPQAEAPGLFWTCMFSTYFTEQIPAIMREVNARYDIDGQFTNGWPPYDRLWECSCDVCRGAPPNGSPECYDRYLERTLALWKLYDDVTKEKRPDNVYLGNIGSGVRAVTNLKVLGERCDWFNCDNQGRGGEAAPAWGCAQQGRAARAIMKGRTITNVTGAWSTGRLRWRNTAKSRPESDLWMAQTAASGMRIWYHWLGAQRGLGADRRWLEPGRDFLRWQARHDPHFTYQRPIATLGVVLAQRPNSFYTAPGGGDYTEFVQGLYAALLEGRFLFDFVHEDDLGPETLRKFSALVLPNVALLSDEQCRQLRAYAEAGGSLLATFETGLFDERGKPRDGFGLGDVFGIERTGATEAPHGCGFFAHVEQRHEILRGLEGTSLLPGGEFRVPVTAAVSPVLSVVRSYTAYPPELVYSPEGPIDEAAAIASERGRSRRLYFAGDIERSAWRSGNTDLALLLQNSVRWLLRGESPVSVEGEGLVEVFAWETEPGLAVHLLNYTNPNLHKGWLRQHHAIGPQRVAMALPAGARVARAELLRAETSLPFTQDGARVEFTIPRVDDYEVAALTLA